MRRTIYFLLLLLYFPITLFAQLNYSSTLEIFADEAPEIVSRAAVLIDAHTGTILYAKNPDEEISPASLTKLMTMHLVMKAINEGRASYDEIVPITEESWAQNQPLRSSLMFLEPGQTVTLREILLGLAVSSGNDAAAAAALRFSPTIRQFAAVMTAEAQGMGLYATRFAEPSGISAVNMTTAAEFASFCRHYINMHPHTLLEFHSVLEYAYPMSHNAVESKRYNPKTIVQENRNILLRTLPGTDGLKTGFINESGNNIALTVERDQTRFILVLLGAPRGREGPRIRAQDCTILIEWAFANFKTVRPKIEKIENVRLWKGKQNSAELIMEGNADFTANINRANKLIYEIVIPNPLKAPLSQGYLAGYINIKDEYGELSRTPLVTAASYEKGNIFKRLWHSVMLLLRRNK